MAKTYVIATRKQDGDVVVDTELTSNKLLEHFQVLVNEVAETTGKREVEMENKTSGEKAIQTLANNAILIDPESRKKFKEALAFMNSAFMANRKGTSVGRTTAVDLDALQKIYVETLASNRNKKRGTLNMDVASKYNQQFGGEIDQNYVARQVKQHGWDSVAAQVNETETVSV